jgi:hypothetical protein
MHRSLLVILASALALGCDDRPGVTDPGTRVAPSSAAVVTRLEAPFPEVVIDIEQGLTALFGIALEELPGACAGGEIQDLTDILIVTHPTRGGETVDHFRVKDQEGSAIVWAAIPEGSICELLGVQPLAVGTVHRIFTDNDFFNTGPGMESVGFRAQGIVTNPVTAQRYQLHAGYQAHVFPDGTREFPVEPFVRLK